jgi:CheY-specific phosphatase CheX
MSVISEAELQEVVEVVWMTALELPVYEGDLSQLKVSDSVTAVIDITGAWHGTVAVRASKKFLTHAASLMFSTEESQVAEQDLNDTLTEMTNMLGGTVKCLLPETCDLALPILVGDDYGSALEWVGFDCSGSPLAVAVSGADAGQKAA